MTDKAHCAKCHRPMVKNSEGDFVCLVKDCSPTPAPRKEGPAKVVKHLHPGEDHIIGWGLELCGETIAWIDPDEEAYAYAQAETINKALAPLLARAENLAEAWRMVNRIPDDGPVLDDGVDIGKKIRAIKDAMKAGREALAAWDSIKKDGQP